MMNNELANHVAHLLLENDCVIVPSLGGFVAHYVPAKFDEKEGVFVPPTREIAFNVQLRLNDGLLAQSYMTAYDLDFREATAKIRQQVKEAIYTLHSTGQLVLPNVGELRFTMQQSYLFVPYDERITSPTLYGLDVFAMPLVATLEEEAHRVRVAAPAVASSLSGESAKKVAMPIPAKRGVRMHPAVARAIRITAVSAAAVAAFFILSKPVENTYISKQNYAEMLPTELFAQIAPEASVTSADHAAKSTVPIEVPVTSQSVSVKQVSKESITQEENKVEAPSLVETSTPVAPTKVNSRIGYHLIVSSVTSSAAADGELLRLKKLGLTDLMVLEMDGKYRVSAGCYRTSNDAKMALEDIRKIAQCASTWMLRVRK
ncbi:MAG TPA: SPOR domain-containing protein [Bacteroidaceae bacterium]|nr:SPOR domain-containing protein [Bacteroidaceae bacterium]